MMNEHAYFHWDLLRQPLQTSQFGMGAPFFDVNSILELRKEKSRDAARSRRGKENYEFYELAKLLPLPAAITSQLDKASIIRLTISYLKLRDFSCHGDPQWTPEGGIAVNKISKSHQSRLDIIDPFESRQGTHILQSLDGFAFILGSDGRFLYISETVSIYLGLSQVEMAGSSVFEYVHPQDHTELAEQLGMCIVPIGSSRSPHGSGSEDSSSPATPRPGSPSEKGYMMVSDSEKSANKSFSLRMKSTLTKRGVHVKTSGYRVIHVLGTLRPQSAYGLSRSGAQNNCSNANTNTSSGNSNISETLQLLGFVGMAIALPPPTITELRLELDTFITKLSPDFKVIYCEPIISDLMDLSIEDVTDRLLYDLCHAADLQSLRRSHLDILNKGQALTDYYRLMNRHGGFVWIQTCATTLLNNKNADDQSILAINFVVSSVDSNNCPIDLWQLTGDVTSSMSSSSNSQSRQEKLKELRTKKPSVTASTRSKTNSPSIQTGALSPSTLPGESSKAECKTPGAVSPKLPADHSGEDTEEPSPGKISGNVDHKNKRRKMENPKKRKRSNCDPQGIEHEDKALNLTRSGAKTTVISRTPHNVNSDYQNLEKSVGDRRVITSGLSLHTDSVTSSSPEDLSIKRSVRPSNDRNIIQHSSKAFKITNSPATDKLKAGSFLNVSDSHSPNQLCITGSSVKELEAAMNRHLPASSSTVFPSQNERHSFDNVLMDPSGAIKGFSGFPSSGTATNPQHSSTPWIPSSRGSESEMLTASNFLRSLYASRESVIKTNSRSQTSFLNSDPPTSLLTPPEPDPATYRDPNNPYLYGKSEFSGHGHIYDKESELDVRDHLYKEQTNRDQFTFIQYKDHIPSAYMDHISSAVYKDHITSTYKELSPYKDIIPAFTIPSLMSPTGRMHQAYPSFHHHFTVPITSTSMDACSITPPSSNSPDLNKHLSASQQFNTTSYSTDLANACNLSQKQNIISSVSPSASSTAIHSHHYHHSRHHKDNFYQGVSSVDAAKSGYYGVSTSSTGAMYTELNQNSSGSTQYETCTRPVLPWY